MISTLRLPCGAAVAAETAQGARSFAAGFWFPIGSRHEAPHERGFVHFVEHMTFKGTARRSAAGISREIDRVGGYINAFTDRDSLCLHCQVPGAHWRLALDVLADMALGSIFRAEDFEREREVIASEILSAGDDPEECSHDEFLSAIWPGDPLSRKIAGEPEDVRRIARDSLYAFYQSEFSPWQLLVTSSGPVSSVDVAEELSRILDGVVDRAASLRPPLSSRAASQPRAGTTPLFSAAGGYVRADMEQVHFYDAVQLDPPFGRDDYFSLSALNGAIGEASSSRLFVSLREDKGLCYSVYSGFAISRTECLWLASAIVSPDNLPALAAEMDRQLDDAAEKGLGDEECADAVGRLSGSFELALEDTDFRMRRIARQIFFSGEAMTPEEERESIARLGPAELNAACARLLGGRSHARFAYGGLSRKAARATGLDKAKVPGPAPAKLSGISAAARRG
jgi:predicted Zn-dependent peptidase